MVDNNNVSEKVLVRRGRVDSVDLYEVKDNELDILENGEPDSLYLNFSIFLFSIAASGICALTTATFRSPLIQNSFLFVVILGILLGLILFIFWIKRRKSIKSIIKTIRDRIPPDSGVDLLPNSTTTTVTVYPDVINNPPPPQG